MSRIAQTLKNVCQDNWRGGRAWTRVAAVFQGQDELCLCGWLVAVTTRNLLICTSVFLRVTVWNPILDVTSTQTVLRLLGRR